jgi:DNA-3-methyladenine glycosylase
LLIDRTLDGVDLCRTGPLWIGTDGIEAGPIGETVRIGITKDAERLLRYHLLGNPFVSGPRSLNG